MKRPGLDAESPPADASEASPGEARGRAPKKLTFWIVVLGAAAAFGLYAAGDRTDETIAVGRPAPAFTLPSVDGGEVSLIGQKGRVVFLNFWATWCKPCEEEMPAMERLYRELQGDRFEMLAIAVGDSADDVKRFRERLGLGFPILLDEDREIAGRYQSFRFPETYWIDEDGVLLSRFIGPRDWDAGAYVTRLKEYLP